ncbi:DNA/RNA polymerase [Teratosphaeria nubilosa]|uniref:DNA-directed RNA polymerase n=1 Tax=Teratosphaeria nubilosa TaxID=161662 RepID=A0A6G1LIL9_9PEZI|nr:DNA/RNA polymerase [Teratosphaeria nubilosa]
MQTLLLGEDDQAYRYCDKRTNKRGSLPQRPINTNPHIQSKHLIKVQNGIYGTALDLLQHLHTSIQIGRLSRAEAIIRRLAEQASTKAPELLHAHNLYLEEFLRTLASQGKSGEAQHTLKAMQRWFELEVRKKGVQPDGKMLVVMTRAAIRGMQGKHRDRAIRRYADWAETLGPDVHDEVLGGSEAYDDNEFTILGRATSKFYDLEPEPSAQPTLEAPAQQQKEFARGNLDLDALPQVRATEQKGGSLESVKKAMQTFIGLPPLPEDAPIEAQRERALERQRLMEETSVEIAIDKWRKADDDLRKIGILTVMQSKPMGALMWQWYQSLLPALQKELAEVKKLLNEETEKKVEDRYHYGPYMELLPPEKLAANTILFVMSRMASGKNRSSKYESEPKLVHLTTGLGRQLEAETIAEASMRKSTDASESKSKGFRRARKALVQKLKQKGARGLSVEERSKLSESDLLSHVKWPLATQVKFGAMLVQKLIECAHLPVTREHPRTKEKITQMQPAFLHRMKWVLGKKIGVVAPNPALLDKLQSEPMGSMIAKQMPMVVEPQPWNGWSEGGYLHYSNPILRLAAGSKDGKDYFMAADRKGDMGQVYAGLTALSKVPWKVHPGVLKVQIEAWNSGDEVANFAPLHPKYDIPPEPEAGSDPGPRRRWLQQLRDVENRKSGLHSKRCFQNFQLEIARTVSNETLYFPHNMDFRGRAYPIPPYLNHMGADNVRGLLVFAEGKPLGEAGLRWLKIHMATVAGYDKASMEDRIRFTEEHMDEIRDSVENPLGGKRWWLQAEDAWQTLAACFELTAALDSPDPTKFVSHLPVQQDGTCNGLQHYAALGGDEIGARQVNLMPGDKPADVYTAVAEAVKAEVKIDAEAGHPIAQKLHGRITRKCVKQPVMTNVYGVTFYGAKEQVLKQLEILFPETENRPHLRTMSSYIAIKIFKSLGTMFRGAQAIQFWLGQCADRIATCLTREQTKQLISGEDVYVAKTRKNGERKADKNTGSGPLVVSTGTAASDKKAMAATAPLFRSTVVWTTPLRLPVVQPYRKAGSKEIKTNLQTIRLQEPQVWDPVSKRKQLQAFPPNFIHSLDATHMLLSALKCNERGLTFASIHDSFWTHACDVNTLSEVLRDAFVEMHSEDIIGRLKEEFEMRYKDCMYLASVNANSKVGKRITELRRTLKATVTGKGSELALEVERLRLLNSEDAADQEKGKKMVTPASLIEASGEGALAAPSELAGQALGEMPVNADAIEAEASPQDGEVDVTADLEATNTDADSVRGDFVEAAESPEGVVGGSPDEAIGADAGAEMDLSSETADAAVEKSEKKPKKRSTRKINVWLPMQFPDMPQKGAFDVRKLRESRYFFH